MVSGGGAAVFCYNVNIVSAGVAITGRCLLGIGRDVLLVVAVVRYSSVFDVCY